MKFSSPCSSSPSSIIILLLLTGSLFLGTTRIVASTAAVEIHDMKSTNRLMKPTPRPTPTPSAGNKSFSSSSLSDDNNNNNNEDNRITVYGLDRSVPLTKDETVYLEETIKEAYDEIHHRHHHEGEKEMFVAAPSSSSFINILADVDDDVKPTEPSTTDHDHDHDYDDDNASTSLLSSDKNNDDDDDSNRITVYGIDRTVPLTKDESEFLEKTIQEAYDETHHHHHHHYHNQHKEGKNDKEEMFVHVVDINKATWNNKNNKKSPENIPPSSNTDDDVPTTSFLRAATRNPVVTEIEKEGVAAEETINSATAPKSSSISSTTGFVFIIVSAFYVVLA